MRTVTKKNLAGILIFAGVFLLAIAISCTNNPKNTVPSENAVKPDTSQGTDDTILYWTCSMHPTVRSDKPGDCPICGMDLIPVRKKDQGSIIIDTQTTAKLGIKTAPVEIRDIDADLHLQGRVANDQELFIAQQEYLSAVSVPGDLTHSAQLKLFLMGMSEPQIQKLRDRGTPDEALISPSPNRAWIYAQVYEADIGSIRPGQNVMVTFPAAYPGLSINGVIRSVSPIIDPEIRSVTARIEVINHHRELLLGMYADVHVTVKVSRGLVVPATAVINTGVRKLVYLETEPGRFVPRTVKTGTVTDELVEIVDGVKPGDRVVTTGNFLLDSQSTLAGGQSLIYGNAADVEDEMPTRTAPAHQH
ncbi:MAG TPA: efflux RND transporter periplasmic adaptor subunit [bacterium]